ncbi:MAG: DUF4012 domain-containing protein [Candidatus Shapirobacteria bacterium]|nr:DUF4012 domain-containing protein [Candidatus Shapirobacteria bacterium]MDD3002689.1 DUF4012 domain-containing protein [Candidatus Shapirobacteria bacterium]MDD4382893.1 DUF4012 domain-containing protein [Candidatus Shapirobacteria bacterium]
MNPALPYALIIGIDQFAAKKLAEELSNKDINVVGVGEYVAGLSDIKNFELLMDLSEVSGKFNYVFDFLGDKNLWKTDQFKGEKITLVCVNDRERAEFLKDDLDDLNLNWRMVEAEGVYGPGMDENNFLAEAIKLAVVNKNLVLPSLKSKFRILAIEDLVEAILRASFLSGTEKEKFLILGEETNSEEVAKVLIDEAKMTRYKVMQKEIEIEKIDEERLRESVRKLRWEPKSDFKGGITETLQYFFSRADEESRKPKKPSKPPFRPEADQPLAETGEAIKKESEPIKKEVNKRKMEVVVEDEQEEVKIKNEEPMEEIESFYKQKKMGLEVEKVKSIQNPSVSAIAETSPLKERENSKKIIEEFDDSFEDEIIKPTHSAVAEFPSLENGGIKKEVEVKPKRKMPVLKISAKLKWWVLFLVVLLLILPVKWTILTVLACNNIKENVTLIEAKKYKQVEILADKNLIRIKDIDQQIDDWGLNKFKIVRNYQTLLKIGEDVLNLEKDAIVISQSADLISQAIFKEREINFSDELSKEEEYLINFDNELGLVLARLNGDYSWMPAKWRISLQKEAQGLKEIKEKLNLVSKGMKILPEMLGLDGRKREYLVLLQNEAELRATGGFIGSYAILSFQNGKLLNFEVKDVYEADGQLKGHVEPPIEIKNYLGEANWFMRDANWNPDFVKASADIQWFLSQEINKKVDGVIGINLAVAKAIVGVIGEINVTDFKEKITKDNLYEQAEYYSESKFFPGSTQKASFLGTLGSQMFEEIKGLKAKQQLELVSSLVDLLEKNEIQLAFNNGKIAKLAADLGWDGTMYQGKCTKENCFSDYLFVVDSNFGVNKTNYFLSRSMEQVVDINESLVERTLKVNYENMAKSNDFPGGEYKNYLRIYLPIDVNLSQISVIDDKTNSRKIYTADEIRIKEINGKKEVGFLVAVPILSKETVEIKYSSANNLTGKDKFSYISYVQKQSGFGDTGLVTLVSFPRDWQPLQVEPQASMVGGKLLFNQKLNKDIRMGVELGK